MHMMEKILIIVFALVSVHAQMDIRLPPSILPATSTPSYILYESDIEVTLPCIATGSPAPTYEWIRDGDVLDVGIRNIHVSPDSRVGTIRIDPITSLDEGFYQCRAYNTYGTSVCKIFFLQKASFGRYPPTSIQTYTKKQGMPLKLNCFEIKSIPTPTYSWALVKTTTDENPVGLVPSRRVIRDENGNLYFSYVTMDDARVVEEGPMPHMSLLYTCNVFNSFLDFTTGGSYSRIMVTEGDLSPKPPSLQHSTQSPYIAVKGGKIRIQCIFAGMPEVTVTWEPMPGGRSDTDEHGTVLEIDDVQFSDEAVYNCTGRNEAGVISESIKVDVQASPEFEVYPSNMNATEMDTVSVECRATQDTEPPAYVSWFIDGIPVDPANPGNRTEITDNGQRLTISNVCKDCPGEGTDLQVIQCNASNVRGYVFADGYLNVLLKTVIVTAPQEQTIDNKTTIANFDCEARSDASTPVTISWERDGKPLAFYDDERLVVNITSNSLMVKLNGLSMEERKKYAGTYTCIATNTYSTQDASAKLTIEDNELVTSTVVTSTGVTSIVASKGMRPYGPSPGILILLNIALSLVSIYYCNNH